MGLLRVVSQIGTSGELHRLEVPQGVEVEAWLMLPTSPAVVMGSAQAPEAFELGRLGADVVELASRGSGGGAVFVNPEGVVWIDVLLARGSRLWSDELSETFLGFGRVWLDALIGLGVDVRLVTDGGDSSPLARAACWASTGWGEVVLGEAKIVGLSQRRTRWGVRIQSMAVLDGSAARVVDYLRPTDELDLDALRSQIGDVQVGLDRASVVEAVLGLLRCRFG